MTGYRKIWSDNYGPIPVDENGRSYEIHHIDGDRDNNSLDNLMCISIEEHYRIHYEQGDFFACGLIGMRMNDLSPREVQLKLVKEGKHPWIKKNRGDKILGNQFTSETSSKLARERAKAGILPAQINASKGKHHWQTEEHSKRVSELNKIRKKNTVTVTDLNGESKRIPRDVFEKQKNGSIENWKYVGVASFEARKRRESRL